MVDEIVMELAMLIFVTILYSMNLIIKHKILCVVSFLLYLGYFAFLGIAHEYTILLILIAYAVSVMVKVVFIIKSFKCLVQYFIWPRFSGPPIAEINPNLRENKTKYKR